MSNILKELQAEISRLARKEIKGELAQVKKINASQRGLIAGLRRQVDALQKEMGVLKKAAPKAENALAAAQEPQGRFWITGKGVKALRKRLGLTQVQFGKLAGVSGQSVVNWEGSTGKLDIRKAAAGKLQEIRGMGKKEVAEILGSPAKAKKMVKAKAPKKARAKRKAKKA
jgi:DNA-binding transcriptional regulator YiaG